MAKVTNRLKEFALESCSQLLKDYGLEDSVDFKFVSNFSKDNGRIRFVNDLDSALISINLLSLSKSSDDNNKIFFNTFSTIVHELSHAKLLLSLDIDYNDLYDQLITLLEYGYYANVFNIDRKKLKPMSFDVVKLSKIMNRNYYFSTPEIYANREGYKFALNKFSDKLKDDDIKAYKSIVDSLNFLDDQMEIFYLRNGSPVNKFSIFTVNSAKYLNRNSHLHEKYKSVKLLFDDKGNLINPYNMFLNVNNDNKSFYDKLIINWLISFEIDFSSFFKNEDFKSYVEGLIHKYINDAIKYYKNMNLGKIFIEDNDVLIDNFIFKKKSIIRLIELAKKYGLDVGNSLILDSSVMMSTKNLVRQRSN